MQGILFLFVFVSFCFSLIWYGSSLNGLDLSFFTLHVSTAQCHTDRKISRLAGVLSGETTPGSPAADPLVELEGTQQHFCSYLVSVLLEEVAAGALLLCLCRSLSKFAMMGVGVQGAPCFFVWALEWCLADRSWPLKRAHGQKSTKALRRQSIGSRH